MGKKELIMEEIGILGVMFGRQIAQKTENFTCRRWHQGFSFLLDESLLIQLFDIWNMLFFWFLRLAHCPICVHCMSHSQG